ncbi:MAG: response regulator [Candidatus Omnitrophica bacterium]|nr:response regulator [Candidatus Omnitrophota bacterium]
MTPFKPKILIVDDEPEARTALARNLKAKGYDVLEMGAGKEVPATARSEWPTLIVLDVVLPDVPGTEVLKQLRADPITKAIPVLLLTAKPDIVEKLLPLTGNTDRTLEKPGRLEDILKTIHEMVTGAK